jgi:hypothetical protein
MSVRDWMITDNKKHWQFISGHTNMKGFLEGLSAKRTVEMFLLNKN